MKTNFILIDFENVQPENLSLLHGGDFKILVFVGALQTKLPRPLVLKLQSLGDLAEYVEISGSGRNALDFHIAYYLGRLAAAHPSATFHLITRDTGFDLLLKHLKTKKISCQRYACLSEIPGLKRESAAPAPTKVKIEQIPAVAEKVSAILAKNTTNRPRTLRKLCSFLKPFLGTHVTEARISELVEALGRAGALTVTDTKVTYPAP